MEIIDRLPGITDSHLPGYVYLEFRYLLTLTECTDDDRYNATDRQWYLANISYDDYDDPTDFIHGPAVCNRKKIQQRYQLT